MWRLIEQRAMRAGGREKEGGRSSSSRQLDHLCRCLCLCLSACVRMFVCIGVSFWWKCAYCVNRFNFLHIFFFVFDAGRRRQVAFCCCCCCCNYCNCLRHARTHKHTKIFQNVFWSWQFSKFVQILFSFWIRLSTFTCAQLQLLLLFKFSLLAFFFSISQITECFWNLLLLILYISQSGFSDFFGAQQRNASARKEHTKANWRKKINIIKPLCARSRSAVDDADGAFQSSLFRTHSWVCACVCVSMYVYMCVRVRVQRKMYETRSENM